MHKGDLPQLTGLRGLAALIVLLGHLRTPEGLTLDFGLLDPFARFGGFGVDLFFVLSGYILCHVYATRMSTGIKPVLADYAVARFARIYPLHAATLLLMLGAGAAAAHMGTSPSASGYSVTSAVLSLLLVSEWVGAVAPNPSAWSISVEFANYLLFPWLVPVLARARRLAPLAVVAGAVLVALAGDWRLGRGIGEFMMGCAAFYAARDYPVRWGAWLSGPLFAAPFLLAGWTGDLPHWQVATCLTAAVLLLSRGAATDPFNRLCASRLMVFFGEISYSVYLLQWFIWVGWKHVLAKLPLFAAHPYLMVSAAALTIIAASSLSYYAFENPSRRWLRANLGRSDQSLAAPSAAPPAGQAG